MPVTFPMITIQAEADGPLEIPADAFAGLGSMQERLDSREAAVPENDKFRQAGWLYMFMAMGQES